jgi:hypothetical protein
VDDAAGPPGLMRADRALAFEDGDPDAVVPKCKLPSRRQPDDPGSHDDDVALARGVAGVRHRAIVITIRIN